MSEIKILQCVIDAPTFVEFYEKWKTDILYFHPDFEMEGADLSALLTLNTEGLLIGIFIYQSKGDEIHIDVDYVIPAFRNKGVAANFFKEKLIDFKKLGYKIVYTVGTNPTHTAYLLEHNFVLSKEHSELFYLKL